MIVLKSSSTESFHLQGLALQLRCLSPGDEIHRLYRFPGGDFHPAPLQYRTGRLDPPPGRSDEYGMLYAADSLLTAALECGALLVMPTDPPTYERSAFAHSGLPPVRHAVLRALRRVKFLDFTHSATAAALGLNLHSVLDDIPTWRKASARAVLLLRQAQAERDIVGICYHSKRSPTAINYALIHGKYQHAFVVRGRELADLQ